MSGHFNDGQTTYKHRLRREMQPELKGMVLDPTIVSTKIRVGAFDQNEAINSMLGLNEGGPKFDDDAYRERQAKMQLWQSARRKQKSAIVIFYHLLGHLRRKHYLQIRKSIVQLQCHLRRRRARAFVSKILYGIVCFQKYFRSRLVRIKIEKWRRLVRLIEALRICYNSRMVQVKKQFQSATRIQSWWRVTLAKRILKVLCTKRNKSVEYFRRREGCVAIVHREQGNEVAKYLNGSVIKLTMVAAVIIAAISIVVPICALWDVSLRSQMIETDLQWVNAFTGSEISDISVLYNNVFELGGLGKMFIANPNVLQGTRPVVKNSSLCTWITSMNGTLIRFSNMDTCFYSGSWEWYSLNHYLSGFKTMNDFLLYCGSSTSPQSNVLPSISSVRNAIVFLGFSLVSLFVSLVCCSIARKYIAHLQDTQKKFQFNLRNSSSAVRSNVSSPDFSKEPLSVLVSGILIMGISWGFVVISALFGAIALKQHYFQFILPYISMNCDNDDFGSNKVDIHRMVIKAVFMTMQNVVMLISRRQVSVSASIVILECVELVLYLIPVFVFSVLAVKFFDTVSRLWSINVAGTKKYNSLTLEMQRIEY